MCVCEMEKERVYNMCVFVFVWKCVWISNLLCYLFSVIKMERYVIKLSFKITNYHRIITIIIILL